MMPLKRRRRQGRMERIHPAMRACLVWAATGEVVDTGAA
jgi:hypothetical protein